MSVLVREVAWSACSKTLIAIRRKVFVQEQLVPEDLELDGLDDQSTHFLATWSGTSIGTGRLLPSGQIGRMAVLSEHRNRGVGQQILHAAVARAIELNYENIHLHAQTHAIDFYLKNGFELDGPEFDDAGIPHRTMRYKTEKSCGQ